MAKRAPRAKRVEALKHDEASRANIPTAEYESVMADRDRDPVAVAYSRRNPDLDPQLVWRGKDMDDWSNLVVPAPPLFIQEKVHPKVLIDDLLRAGASGRAEDYEQTDLFADFNGVPDGAARTEFYEHEANWANRMILGDSLQVMASLAEREGLREQVQCIYLDPPYGIKFNSNFQWSTTSRDVKDQMEHITREPEQVRAFRDTWRDGIHSYLTYLRDRLTVARDLLSPAGSIFVQIGDENVHVVRALMDEVFGTGNFLSLITVQTTSGFKARFLGNMSDFIIWYAKDKATARSYPPYYRKDFVLGEGNARWLMFPDFTYRGVTAAERRGEVAVPADTRPYEPDNIISQGRARERQPFDYQGRPYDTWERNSHWKASYPTGMERLAKAGRIHVAENSIRYVRYHEDFELAVYGNMWTDTGTGNFTDDKVYIVQTNSKVVERCLLMATNPGDLVLDPTCGSGTTAFVAEQWGRRWITIDTSRVSLALARARVMGGRYPFYLLADSPEGQAKEAELTRQPPTSPLPSGRSLKLGFVYDRVPHVELGGIANNAEIDVVWDRWQQVLEPLRATINAALGESWEEWEVPRTVGEDSPDRALAAHTEWWQARRGRQDEIDAVIAARAEFERLRSSPYEDKSVVRVAGPFTVESLSPHRAVSFDEDEERLASADDGSTQGAQDFAATVLDNLAAAGVEQAHKADKLTFVSVEPWPGRLICGEGRYREGDAEDAPEKRAGIFVGPEFGTVSRADLVAAAREAGDADFDVLVSCAFNYEARASEFDRLGRIPVLKARMNADLHMADDLKNTGKGNLFVVFGEPDIEIVDGPTDDQIRVRVNGVDVFDPSTGEVRSDNADGIACWFVDSDYNEESFFVRQAYFLGANDPYEALRTTLKAEIDEGAWETLHSDISRPFKRPASGRIAVKVINHLGDEVMKVLRVG
jgi:adenine-specific DNA-methyltransferase